MKKNNLSQHKKKIQLEFLDKPIQATDEELKAATSLFKAKSKPAMNTRRKGKSLPGGEDTFDVREALKNTPRSGSISVSSKRITPQERDEDLNREGIRKLKTCLTQLETGYFEAALQSVEGSINDYTSLSDVVSKRKEIKICVSYKIALILLQESKKQEEKDLNLLVFLTTLPLKPEHRIINIRRLINLSIKAGNYGIASQLLDIIIPLNLKDKDDLEKKLKECQQAGKKDTPTALSPKSTDGKIKRFCYKTHKPISGAHLECSFCSSTYSSSSYSSLERCSICTFGMLTEVK